MTENTYVGMCVCGCLGVCHCEKKMLLADDTDIGMAELADWKTHLVGHRTQNMKKRKQETMNTIRS